MKTSFLIDQLKSNREVIRDLLFGSSIELFKYKPSPQAWCLLEIICHLVDEEREDFRARIIHVIKSPETFPPPIDPKSWVKDRQYMDQDFDQTLEIWTTERDSSLNILEKINPKDFRKGFDHEIFGRMSGVFFLQNWIAHDYLHIRQITRNKYQYLAQMNSESLDYAGNW